MACKLSFSIVFTFAALSLSAQISPSKYWIQFTDKNNSPYSINSPEEYLSTRAIERRKKQNIPIKENDLPVNPSYIDSIKAKGAQVLYSSKWFNGVVIYTSDSLIVEAVDNLPFVSGNVPLARKPKDASSIDKFDEVDLTKSFDGIAPEFSSGAYGDALNQINMIGGLPLHEQGYRGEGMVIAVLDAGFDKVNLHSVFNQMFAEGRWLGGKDFVDGDNNVFAHHGHGTNCLSIMAADQKGDMIGTAPDASYWLIRTEDGGSEYLIEEYNWLAGAEFADSVGVDIINSSLGYTTFDESTQNHSYADMDGNTTPITRAADIAASKGILVVNSAGNSGSGSWYYIGAPADGDSVLAIGATDEFANYVDFSSKGPSYDGRVKPNVVAKGYQTTIVNVWDGSIIQGNGTSFSGPVIAGISACLWQANPDKTNMEVLHAIEKSAAHYNDPNEFYGYGLPNLSLANMILKGVEPENISKSELIFTSPNPFDGEFTTHFYSAEAEWAVIQLTDMNGHTFVNQACNLLYGGYYETTIKGLENLSQGIYIVAIRTQNKTYYSKLLKR